jgi:NADPH-dependent glutamate synthase beta subunit-like oxidoreductase
MVDVTLTIDGLAVTARKDATILAAADAAGIYVPRLCAHPDLPPVSPEQPEPWSVVRQGDRTLRFTNGARYDGCGLCEVEIAGQDEPVRACHTPVAADMEVTTTSEMLSARRRSQLGRLFATHPHACIQCAQKTGCAREPCSTDVAKEERCCAIFHDCELRRVAEYVGIPDDTPRYSPAARPLVASEPLLRWDHELCVGCLRCVRICRDVRGIDALGFVLDEQGRPQVGTRAATLLGSGCQFCLSCAEVCPTGSLQLTFEEARVDGARAPNCIAACPAGIDVPRYLREIRRGDFARAEAVVREAAPLPRVLSQVCFHPCEDACLRGELASEPLAVCALKRAAVELAEKPLWKDALGPPRESGRKVAIVGAGPAGLSAAWFLRLRGHRVAVYEAQPAAGGWLRDGIPAYRLSQDALAADVADIAAIGVDFRCGVEVGRDVDLSAMRAEHDAVLVAVGARRAKRLSCPGSDRPGVAGGLELLQRVAAGNGSVADELRGEIVVVVGGGNVAIDVARTALRLGAAEVHLYCLEHRDTMPAHAWEVAEAEREGVVVHDGWGPARITGTDRAEGIEFAACVSVFDDEGRFAPRLDGAQTVDQRADRVLVAIGQEPVLQLFTDDEVAVSAAGMLAVDGQTLQTVQDDVFAGGEVVTGPASVVDAVAQGRRVAASIDRRLGGDGRVTPSLLSATEPDPELAPSEEFAALARVPVPHLPADAAVAGFDPVEGGYSAAAAVQEASRCLRCDLRLALRPNPPPPEPWLAWTTETVAAVPAVAGAYQLVDEEKQVYAIKGVSDLRAELTALLESTSRARYFLYEEDPLFSKRESELIQEYLQQHGSLPPGEGDDDLDDLF